MAEHLKPPMICAVCGNVLDQWLGGWIHSSETLGKSDHVAVPIDYDEQLLVTHCDFCHCTVPLDRRWVIPATDFLTPVGYMSAGNWAACPPCAQLVTEGKWTELVDQFMERMPQHERAEIRVFMVEFYDRLRKHQTGAPRPFQPGDEAVEHQEV